MKYLKVLIWPIIFMIGEFFIQYLFVAYFNFKYYSNIDLYSVINTIEYQNHLNNFISNNSLLIIIISSIIFIPVFYLIFRKYKEKCQLNNIKYFIFIGIILSLTYNLYLSFIIDYKVSKLPIVIQIISSGILGPILEELLFRGVVYNKLKKFNSIKKSMIITTIIFSIIHFNIIDCIYTLFIGYILVYVYEKYKDIRYSIIIHISANIAVILLGLFINISIVLNIILFIICLFVIFLLWFKYNKNNNYL